MVQRRFSDIDLSRNELRNAVIHPAAASPVNPRPGQVYYDTTMQVVRQWNGSSWVAMAPSALFGGSPVANTDYVSAKAGGMLTNGTGALGNGYTWPTGLVFDAEVAPPGCSASMRWDGRPTGLRLFSEAIAVDASKVYEFGGSVLASGHTYLQYVFASEYDADDLAMGPAMSMAYGRLASRTVLTQPLAPGDTKVYVQNSSGWGNSTMTHQRGLRICEYRNSFGRNYGYDYTRIFALDLFNVGGNDTVNNVVTLNKPFPLEMRNPNDIGGVWPVGTRITCSDSGGTYKYVRAGTSPPNGSWSRFRGLLGGVLEQGTNSAQNFFPACARIRPGVMLNYDNTAGPTSGVPVRLAGFYVREDPTAKLVRQGDGRCTIYTLRIGPDNTPVVSASSNEPNIPPV